MQEMHEDISGWELMAFYLQDEFLTKTVNEFRSHLPLQRLPSPISDKIMRIHVNETIRSSFDSLIPYFTLDNKPAERLIEMKFKELLYNIFTEPKNQAILAYVNQLGDESKTPIWEIMESNYMYNMSLEEFASISNRSVASFKRDFKDHYKTSPGKWLTKRRLEQARLLLRTSKKPVGEITLLSGFENMSHFCRIFREKYGMSPSQYRKA
jgi:AraC-like DNA-binding protein